MSIDFDGFHFTEPERLSSWHPPSHSGLYAILIPDSSVEPKPFRVLYFGESSNMSEVEFTSHHRYLCWIHEAGTEDRLYISICLIPNSTRVERSAGEMNLVMKYRPICNY